MCPVAMLGYLPCISCNTLQYHVCPMAYMPCKTMQYHVCPVAMLGYLPCIPWKTMQCHVCLMAMVEYQLGDRASQLGFRRQFTFPGSYWRAGGWEQISRTLPVSPKYWRPKIINVNCPNVCAIVTCNIVTKGGIWWLGKRKGKRWLVRVVVRCDDVWEDVSRCKEMWGDVINFAIYAIFIHPALWL